MKTVFPEKPPRIFIALEAKDGEREKLQCLTTAVMRWSDDVWILDLSLFHSYWQARAASLGSNVVSLWRNILNQTFGMETGAPGANVVSLSSAYSACCAHHPWVAALMLSWMKEKDVSGLILRKSRFGQSLFGEIPWEIWWREISLVENHFLNSKPKGFTQAKFRNQCRRLELAAVRLGFRLPQEMNVLNYSGVRNRFGTTIANVWKWSYGREANAEATLCQTGFPWKEHRFREPPFVKRHLEYPLVLWERIAPLLDEDLDKLCGSLGASGERVTRLDWHVTLDDLSEFHIPIRFRNPHDMRREKGNHLAALLQANYSFTTAARERFPAESDDDYSVPPIVGWEIVLSATLVIPDILYDIFGEIAEKESDIEVLLRLENELPVRLNRFTPQKDWLPEDSYSEKGFGPGEEEMVSSEIERSLDAVAEDRPLYIRNQPLPLQDLKPPATKRFLESTMDKWWKEKDPGHIERNYFKHIDSRGNATWVFQDSNGRWYQHGIFG